MHEDSLIRSLLKQVRQIEQQYQALGTTEIELEIGPLSGVEPLLLRSAFDRAVSSVEGSNRPSLRLTEVPLTLQCEECNHVFESAEFRFECMMCQAKRVVVVRGDAIRLLNVHLRLSTSDHMAEMQR